MDAILMETDASGGDAEATVDILIAFEEDRSPGLIGLSAMELELESLLGHRVDLRNYGDLSRHFRDDVRAGARQIHAV